MFNFRSVLFCCVANDNDNEKKEEKKFDLLSDEVTVENVRWFVHRRSLYFVSIG